jgi:hypothetical protein
MSAPGRPPSHESHSGATTPPSQTGTDLNVAGQGQPDEAHADDDEDRDSNSSWYEEILNNETDVLYDNDNSSGS